MKESESIPEKESILEKWKGSISDYTPKYIAFYFALLLLGVTIGVIHGLSLSPVSSGILEILGAIAAASAALILGLSEAGKITLASDRAVEAFAATVIAIVVGYWLGWASMKYWRIASSALPLSLENRHPDQQADAHRLIALSETLGIPKKISVARIEQILGSGTPRTRKRPSPDEDIILIQALTRVATDCHKQKQSNSSDNNTDKKSAALLKEISQLSTNANTAWLLFATNDSWFKEYKKLTLLVGSMELPDGTLGFGEFLAKKVNCKIQGKDLRFIELLDHSLHPFSLNLQEEIDRLMTMVPALESESFRGPGIENESMKK